ncbi:MAG: hypothetical protein WC907_01590 [Acholeplasmataceae bacterium]
MSKITEIPETPLGPLADLQRQVNDLREACDYLLTVVMIMAPHIDWLEVPELPKALRKPQTGGTP